MKYYVYILQSFKDNTYYVGTTKNIEKRINQHNQGISRSTKGKIPWKLVYNERFNNIKDAYKRERYIKTHKKRKYIEKLINMPL